MRSLFRFKKSTVKKIQRENIIADLLSNAPDIFSKYPVQFVYLYGSFATGLSHERSDLDICIYTSDISRKKSLDLEMSLSLEIDEKLKHSVNSDVRIINMLPLSITGKMVTEGILIFSNNEPLRVDFETMVRCAYFDFLPVIKKYQHEYLKRFQQS